MTGTATGAFAEFQMQHATPNRPWDVTGDGTLRIGARRLALADIQGFEATAHQERDFLASLFNYVAYLAVATVMLVLVVQAGARDRFLLVTLFFVVVGAASLLDIARTSRIGFYRLRIRTTQGPLDFTSADAGEVDRLIAALRRAGIT